MGSNKMKYQIILGGEFHRIVDSTTGEIMQTISVETHGYMYASIQCDLLNGRL